MRASLLTGGSSASLLALLVTTFLTTSTFASPLPIPQSSSTTTYSKPTIPDGPAAALSWSSGPKDNPVIHVFALDNSGNILEWTKTDDGPKGPGSAWSAPTNIGVKAALGSRISVYYDAFKEKGDVSTYPAISFSFLLSRNQNQTKQTTQAD